MRRNILTFGWPILLIAALVLFYLQTDGDKNRAGGRLYALHCANCHMENGQGLRQLIPSLEQSQLMQSETVSPLVCMIKNGVKANPKAAYKWGMPAQPNMSPAEMLALVKYLRQTWGEAAAPLSLADIEAALATCTEDIEP